jgi:predicted acylesterase/phospholipase RssA
MWESENQDESPLMTTDNFHGIDRLAWRGAFAFEWRTVVSFLWNLLVSSIKVVPFVVALAVSVALPDWFLAIFNRLVPSVAAIGGSVSWQIVSLIALTLLLSAIWYFRGLFQEVRFASVLGAVAGVKSLYVRDWGATSGKQGPGVMHVLVATDLLSGEPIYFSSKFVHRKPYGWSTPEQIRTAEALYSSAAFPAVFPPKKLKTSRLRFQDGDMPGPLPRTLRPADGGVYNNLGNDWFENLKKQSQASPSLLWPFGELSVEPLMIETKNVIIVNAGARSRRLQRLGPFPLARIMSVLYDNTARPRVKLIRAENLPLIDIEQTPSTLANSLAELDGDVGRLAKALITKFDSRANDFWADFGRDTAGAKTKLSGAGRRVAARLMLHGYLSSLALLHARFEGKIPEQIRGEGYFLKLVDKELARADETTGNGKKEIHTADKPFSTTKKQVFDVLTGSVASSSD